MRRVFRITAIAGALVTALVVGWVLLPNRLFYRQGRPTALGVRVNRMMGRLGATGITRGWMPMLEVERRSGHGVQRLPVVVGTYQGERYLVSMLGTESQWVKNVAAAGGAAKLVSRRPERIRLLEVPVGDRAPIIKAYLARAWGGRPHIPIPHNAPVEDFAPIAGDYPVFRITPEMPAPERRSILLDHPSSRASEAPPRDLIGAIDALARRSSYRRPRRPMD